MLLHQNGAFVEISHFGHELNSILSSFERKFSSPHLLLPTNPSLSCWESILMERGSSTPSGQTLPSTPLFCLSSPVSSRPSDVLAGAGAKTWTTELITCGAAWFPKEQLEKTSQPPGQQLLMGRGNPNTMGEVRRSPPTCPQCCTKSKRFCAPWHPGFGSLIGQKQQVGDVCAGQH